MEPRELLLEPLAYLAPVKILEGLFPEDADQHLEGAPHSIAEIVAHVVYWQDWFLLRVQGSTAPMAAHASLGWPGRKEAWPTLQARFASGLHALARLAETSDRAAPLSPPITKSPLAHYTLGDVFVHVAQHNAHHLGQVVLLRQLLGHWPPPSGSATW